MLPKKKQTICIFLIVSNLYYLSFINTCTGESSKKSVASFIFGDSLVDVGNNDYIFSLAKANFPLNGIDFRMPTGRFTNGRTIPDILGQQLGLKEFTPPYLAPNTIGNAIMHGVNYAFGGAGILSSSGQRFIGRINLDAQLDNFANTKQELIESIGEEATNVLIKTALFLISIGSNDFLNNNISPIVSKLDRIFVSPETYVDIVISRFRTQLTRLQKMGAQRIVVSNVGPIGCIPDVREMSINSGNNCVAFPNKLAQLFNFQLKYLLNDLNNNFDDALFVYADVYHIFTHILINYRSYGFENTDSACCHVIGRYGGLIPCIPSSDVCPNRSKYVFWDPFHPSEATNLLVAKQLLDGNASVISPINVRQLMSY